MSGGLRQSVYYDRRAGIVYLSVIDRQRRKGGGVVDSECEWGTVTHDEKTGEVVGIELWRPMEMLPADLLDFLPDPTWTRSERVSRPFRWGREWIAWQLWGQRRWRRYLDSPAGQAALAKQEPPRRWYRGLDAPPDDQVEREEYRQAHPDVRMDERGGGEP